MSDNISTGVASIIVDPKRKKNKRKHAKKKTTKSEKEAKGKSTMVLHYSLGRGNNKVFPFNCTVLHKWIEINESTAEKA